jgi:hypothetical protein
MNPHEPTQLPVIAISIERVMRSAAFRRGVDEVRAGKAPHFLDNDEETDNTWQYERGRQFAVIAPRSMPILIERKLNPKAVALFCAAHRRGWLR